MSTEIFQDLILHLHKHPKNELQEIPTNHLSKKCTNPLCGDEVTIIAQPEDISHGQIGQLHFIAEGCAISRASAEHLTAELSHQSTADALAAINQFLSDLKSPHAVSEDISNRNALLSIRRFPARTECAALAWKTLQELLNQSTTQNPPT